MARTLPAALISDVTSATHTPAISVTVHDLTTRLNPFATGPLSGRSAALLSSSGSILRAAVAQAASSNQTITVQRITPSSAPSWAQAGTAVTTNAAAAAGCALAQTSGTTRLFYVRSSDNPVCYRDSSDDGLSWGAETVLRSSPGGLAFCYGMAADSITNLFSAWAAFDPGGMCIIYQSTFASGSWGAWVNTGPSSPAWGQIRGMNVATVSTTRRFAMGVGLRGYVSGISAAWCTWNGSSWSAFSPIQQLDTPSQGLTLSYPDLFYDPSNLYGDGLQWYAIVTMTDDGSISTTAHTRTTIYRSSDGASWQPWLDAPTTLQYGAHLIITGSQVYIFDATTTYTAPAPPAPIDISNDVFSIDIAESYDEPASLALELANNLGQYTGAPWLVDNATITVALGYNGLTVTTHTFYLDDWTLHASATDQSLSIAGRNYLKYADYPVTTQLVFTNQTVAQLAAAICRAAGLTLATFPATTPASQVVPCFIVPAGSTWLQNLKRLAAIYSLSLRADTTPSVIFFDPQTSDPSTWTYGNEVMAASYGIDQTRPNVVRVTGSITGTQTAWSETIDSANLLAVGDERLELIVDRMLDTSAKCLIRAQQELRTVQREATHAALTVALNPQHELGDVITMNEPIVGATNQPLRIAGLSWQIDWETASFEQILSLEAP